MALSARRYAQALFLIAEEKGDQEQWLADLELLADSSRNSDFIAFIDSPKIENVKKIEVIKEAFLDKSDKTQKFASVQIKALFPLKQQVDLHDIKKDKLFRDFSLVKQSRLSVMNVDLKYWKKICKMGKINNY